MPTHDSNVVSRWRAMVADWKQSGLGVLDFCRSRRIHRSGFHRWRVILDELDQKTSARNVADQKTSARNVADQKAASAPTATIAPTHANRIAPTHVNRKAPTIQRVAVPAKPAFVPVRVLTEPLIEVVLASGVIVKAPLHADPIIIARLVRAVSAC